MTRRLGLIAVAAAILLTPSRAFAQEEPIVRFYLVPKIGTGSPLDPFRPKYFRELGYTHAGAIDYGDNYFLVGANLTTLQHTTLIANSDVVAIPALDSQVGGNPTLNQTRNALESRSIPGSWIQSTTTWRQVVARTGDCAKILQRMFGHLGKKLFGTGNALDTTLTATLRDDFIAVGESFGLNTSAITTSINVRTAILTLADQLPSFELAGETF